MSETVAECFGEDFLSFSVVNVVKTVKNHQGDMGKAVVDERSVLVQ